MSKVRSVAASALLTSYLCTVSVPGIARADEGVARAAHVETVDAPPPPPPASVPEPAAPEAAPAEPAKGEPLPPGVVQAQVGELLRERYEWQTRWSNPTLPILMLFVGVAALGAGGSIIDITEEYDCGGYHPCTRDKYQSASIALLSLGVIGVTGSFAAFSFLTTGARKRREIDAIDRQLEALGVQVAPYYSRASAGRGASGGLVTSFRF